MKPRVLVTLPPGWNALGPENFISPSFETIFHGRDDFAPDSIDYFVGFRPEPGFLKTLTHLKAIFSLGAGGDGFLRDPEFPRHVPLVRSVDPNLAREMSEYVAMHVLILQRQQPQSLPRRRRRRWKLIPKGKTRTQPEA